MIIFSSCKKNDIIETNAINQNLNARKGIETIYSDNEMVLGKKLEIPYKIDVVEKSQNSLKVKNKGFKPIKLQENYYYVRILPKNDEEYDLVNSDSTINTFDHPMDYEIIKQGNKYKDPLLKNSKYSYIYCVIPIDKKFKNVKIEILERLYIPFGSGANDPVSKKLDKQVDENLKALDDEILESTGFKIKSRNAKTLGWYPQGVIRVSNGTGFTPVEECTVRTTKALVVTYTDLTDSGGNYFINNSYWNISSVNYDIKWERGYFDIRSGAYGQAYFNGPHQSGNWNLDITSGGTYLNYLYAWAHKAAVSYYYKNTQYGIQQPPLFGGSGNRMHLGVSDNTGASHYFNFNAVWLAADIAIKMGSNAFHERIFATTIHELAHASHWSLGFTNADYALNIGHNQRFSESWAEAVGWFVTAKYFGRNPDVPTETTNVSFTDSNQEDFLSTIQIWDNYYTPVFTDLIDYHNQSGTNPLRPNDEANGYTLGQLEAVLAQCPRNWNSYRDKLAELTNNPTEANAIWIFNNYKDQ